MKKLFVFLIIGLFMISFASAWSFDNVKNSKDTTWDGQSISGNKLLEKYNPIEIKNAFGLGSVIFNGYLSQHTEECFIDCSSTIEIELKEERPLVDDIYFETILEDNPRVRQNVRSYQLFLLDKETEYEVPDYKWECSQGDWNEINQSYEEICENVFDGTHTEVSKEWIPYTLGDNVLAGEYTLKIEGEKKPGRTVDWIIRTGGETLTEWATWGSSNLTNNLNAYYKLDESSGAVLDATGVNNAVNFGATPNVPGKINTAYSFDGVDDFINLSSRTNFQTTAGGNMTFSGWVNSTSIFDDSYNPIFRFGKFSGGSDGYAFNIRNGIVGGLAHAQSSPFFTYQTPLVQNQTYFIVFTFNGTFNIFINGDHKNSSLATDYISPSGLAFIGGYNDGSGEGGFLEGVIDEVGIWNRSLTQAEITALYNSNNALAYPFLTSSINLNNPIDNKILSIGDVFFNATANVSGATIVNMSLWTNETGSWALRNVTTGLSGTDFTTNWTRNFNSGTYIWNVQGCDSDGDCGFSESNSTFTASLFVENNQTFNINTTEGSTESFSINISSVETPTSATFSYNGTVTSADIDSSNFPIVIVSESIVVPNVGVTTNIPFFWNIVSASGDFTSTTKNQTVNNLSLDACSTFTNVLFNYSMVDENTQVLINGSSENVSLEVEITIFSADRSDEILTFNNTFTSTNPNAVCSKNTLFNGTSYKLDSTIKYTSDPRVIEYYNIRNATINNESSTQNLRLYNIKTSESTDFQLTFKDANFIVVEDALIQVQRQYVSEGIFKTVELPITDSNGQTIVHLVRNDIIYNYLVIKNGEIIGNFNNLVAFCEDESIGQCFIQLNALQGTAATFNPIGDDELTYLFTFNDTTRNLLFTFSTNDGSVEMVTLKGVLMDQVGNETVCNSTVTTASGSLTCNIPASIGNETIIATVFVGGELRITKFFSAGSDMDLGIGGYFLLLILVLSLVSMFSESKSMMVVGVIIGFITGGLLFFIQGGIIGRGTAVMWLIIQGALLIWKLNQEGQS